MDKATEFIKDLTERHILGKVAGWCYSVEHQKRGKIKCLFLIEFLLRHATHSHAFDFGQGVPYYYPRTSRPIRLRSITCATAT